MWLLTNVPKMAKTCQKYKILQGRPIIAKNSQILSKIAKKYKLGTGMATTHELVTMRLVADKCFENGKNQKYQNLQGRPKIVENSQEIQT